MYARLLRPPTQNSFFLFGSRGTGKTTWVRFQYPTALYFDLLKAETYDYLVANPTRIEEAIPKDFKDWVVIDEIQKIPALLDEVHRLIENNHYKFILTGSSARKLRRGGVNLLAGRALIYNMHPLTAAELGKEFHLKEYVAFGGLPAVFATQDKKNYLKSYIQTYLQQEVIQEGISRNVGSFARFLETASFSQGSVVNMTEVGREASVGRKVVEDYFSALEDLMLGVRLPVFSKKAKRRLVKHNKFYFFDVGVYQAIRPMGPLDQPEVMGGVALESVFFQNLRAINDYLDLGYTLYYYRTATGVEVDFIAYGKRGLKAFEIKSKKTISRSDISSLVSFLQDYPMAKGYMLYGGSERLYIKNIEILPFGYAVQSLATIL
ncbi:MAG: AAA family ATPase [Candidatus Gottesmanbacteria bacterium]|nr:AAA family ATPase [Candidatus Gottesmanbacteria bacterium]